MLDPAIEALLKPLLDAGGWTFAAIILSLVLLGFAHGDIVPGWIHRREIDRGDKATEIGAQVVNAMTCQADQMEALTNLLKGYIAGSGEAKRK